MRVKSIVEIHRLFVLRNMEKDQLLEIHLLEKTAQHQNLDCTTLFEQMTKIYESAQNQKSTCLVEQMHFLDRNE